MTRHQPTMSRSSWWLTSRDLNGQVMYNSTDPGPAYGYLPPGYPAMPVIQGQLGWQAPAQTAPYDYYRASPAVYQPTPPTPPVIPGQRSPRYTSYEPRPSQSPHPTVGSPHQPRLIEYGQTGQQRYVPNAQAFQPQSFQVIVTPAAPDQLREGWVKVENRYGPASNVRELAWLQRTAQHVS